MGNIFNILTNYKMKSFAVFALIANISAIRIQDTELGEPVVPLEYHWNEDPHSVPNPLVKKKNFTSTVARYYREGKMDTDTVDPSINPRYHRSYSEPAVEPNNPTFYAYVQTPQADDTMVQTRTQSLATMRVGSTVLWHVPTDYGELDGHVLEREADVSNGKKASGWTNPLGWTDNGDGDDNLMAQMKQEVDLVKAQFQSLIQYDESEGPTKADNGEDDPNVVARADVKLTGWVNPLGVTDAGADDDLVLAQTQYDASEGPTMPDNGEAEETVVLREADTS